MEENYLIKKNTKDIEIKNILENVPKNTVIGEFSGRDSVAAIFKVLEDDNINHILPVATFATTEYGDSTSLDNNYEKMIERVKKLYGNNNLSFSLL